MPTSGTKLREDALSTASIGALLDPRANACGNSCKFRGLCCSGVNFASIMAIRQAYWGSSQLTTRQERRSILAKHLRQGVLVKDGLAEFHFHVNGVEVCEPYFIACFGQHRYKQYRQVKASVAASVSNGLQLDGQMAQRLPRQAGAKYRDYVRMWLNAFASHCADKMPCARNRSQLDDTHNDAQVRYRLPFYEKKSVWNEYQIETQHLPDIEPCSYSYFVRIWEQHCPNIELALEGGGFKQCKVCAKFEAELLKHHTPALRQQILEARNAHFELQASQRQKYYKHRRKACLEPNKYLSIIIDGMDQKKTDVPRWAGKIPGWADTLPTYRQRVMGVKVHWKGRCFAYLFLADVLVAGGANLVVECLRQVLVDLQRVSPLPSVLYLQVDNCSENKNRTLFGFLDYLVHRKIFRKVKIGFLMTGHTHEDIGKIQQQLHLAIHTHFSI